MPLSNGTPTNTHIPVRLYYCERYGLSWMRDLPRSSCLVRTCLGCGVLRIRDCGPIPVTPKRGAGINGADHSAVCLLRQDVSPPVDAAGTRALSASTSSRINRCHHAITVLQGLAQCSEPACSRRRWSALRDHDTKTPELVLLLLYLM